MTHPATKTRRRPAAAFSAGGFSLVEVLMAVLILSLGLLGLGAIMPAVLKQQRVGTDQTFGTLAGRSVAAIVKGNQLLNGRNKTGNTTNAILMSYNRWEAWARCIQSAGYAYGIPEDGTWRVLEVEGDSSGIGTGRAIVGPFGPNINTNTDDRAFINLIDRLVPSTSSVTLGTPVVSEPQFVVDLAVRRATALDPAQIGAGGTILYERPGNFTVQVAFITRRIDQRVRPPAGTSILASLTDNTLPLNQRRWPVSEDNNGNPLGDGTNQGAGAPRYSLPYAVNVVFDPNYPDRLVVAGAEDSALPNSATARTRNVAAQQLAVGGQIIVDNLGNIYNVQGYDDRVGGTPQLAVRISPAVVANTPGSGSSDPRRLHQVLVCPQPPAAVNIITVNP
ncbi:MAG: hypothetical protein Q8L55_04980 [Phycisphaerales bacterium]|nr:hypothetical protein [Phycisphaerales bacterium]